MVKLISIPVFYYPFFELNHGLEAFHFSALRALVWGGGGGLVILMVHDKKGSSHIPMPSCSLYRPFRGRQQRRSCNRPLRPGRR